MAQMPALIPKEVEIQRLKKIWLIVIAMDQLLHQWKSTISSMVHYIKLLLEIVHSHQRIGGYTVTLWLCHWVGVQLLSMTEEFQFLEVQTTL